MCSPYLTGALSFVLIFVVFNYWTISVQNNDLMQRVEKMQQQLRTGSDRLLELENNYKAKSSDLSDSHLKLSQCTQEKEDLEKLVEKKNSAMNRDKHNQEEEVNRLNEEKEQLQSEIDSLQDENDKLHKKQISSEAELTQAQTDLLAERAKAQDLQGKLAELLRQQPHIADVDTGAEPQPVLGEGQLPDVDPAAVSVLKKDTLGAPGLKILPSFDAKNSEAYSEEAVLSDDIQDTVFFKPGARGISSTSAIPSKTSDSAKDDAVNKLQKQVAAPDDLLENASNENNPKKVNNDQDRKGNPGQAKETSYEDINDQGQDKVLEAGERSAAEESVEPTAGHGVRKAGSYIDEQRKLGNSGEDEEDNRGNVNDEYGEDNAGDMKNENEPVLQANLDRREADSFIPELDRAQEVENDDQDPAGDVGPENEQ